LILVKNRTRRTIHNVRIMDTVKYDYVIGLRSNHDFVEELKLVTEATASDWEVFDNNGQEIKLKKFVKNLYGKRRFVVLYYSPVMAAAQRENRVRGVDNAVKLLKAQKGLSLEKAMKISNGFHKYFVFERDGKTFSWRVDAVELNRALKRDGKFCMITSLDVPASEVYKLYFSKDKIEKGFRHMKQDVGMHPTRRRLADRVRVDVFVCHLAYLLLRVAEQLARQKIKDVFWGGLSSEAREIRLIEYGVGSVNRRFQAVSNNEKQKIYLEELVLAGSIPLPLQKPK
jgi:transposase